MVGRALAVATGHQTVGARRGTAAGASPGARGPRSSVTSLVAAALGLLLLLTGCAAEYDAPLGDCSPSYRVESRYGNFSAQQSGPGKSIQWGAYPNSSVNATRYVVDVYVGSRRVDHKDQDYAPHGSVSATDVKGRSGQKFILSGTVYDGPENTLVFSLQCVIA